MFMEPLLWGSFISSSGVTMIKKIVFDWMRFRKENENTHLTFFKCNKHNKTINGNACYICFICKLKNTNGHARRPSCKIENVTVNGKPFVLKYVAPKGKKMTLKDFQNRVKKFRKKGLNDCVLRKN